MCPRAEHRDRDRQGQDLSADALSADAVASGGSEPELAQATAGMTVRPITDRGPTPFSPRTLSRWGARFPAAKLCVVRSSGPAESVL